MEFDGEPISDYLSDLTRYSDMQGKEGRQIIYEEESNTEWLSAEYTLDLDEWR